MFCSSCGVAATDGAKFCSQCGAETPTSGGDPATVATPVDEPDQPDSEPTETAASPSGHRGWLVAGISVGVIVLLAAAIGVGVAVGGGDSSKASSRGSGGKPQASSSATTAAQKAEADAAAAAAANAAADDEAMRGFVLSLETILDHSAAGRGDVGTLVERVKNGCGIQPNEASIKIREVIGNRNSVLSELAGMSLPAGNAQAAELRALLQEAINHSVQADIYYQGWMDWLYDDWGYYSNYYWCPYSAPTYYSSYSDALAEDGEASRAKQAFVDAFNPVAEQYGQPTWDPGTF